MDKIKYDSPTSRCVKKALIREDGVPLGKDAELHVVCDCGANVPITPPLWDWTLNKCSQCGTVYDSRGWIV